MGKHQYCVNCSKYIRREYSSGCRIYGYAFPACDVCHWDDTLGRFDYDPVPQTKEQTDAE